jgi:hypothetical protein
MSPLIWIGGLSEADSCRPVRGCDRQLGYMDSGHARKPHVEAACSYRQPVFIHVSL